MRWNEGGLTSGTRMTVPAITFGSRMPTSRLTATIDAYSVPCEPLTSAKTGPERTPWITATGMLSGTSWLASGTVMTESYQAAAKVFSIVDTLLAAAINLGEQTTVA